MASKTSTCVAFIEPKTIQKMRKRLMPFLFLLFVVCYLDRINIGFAALTMNKELAITSQQYGLLSGIFFFGYFLFEVPSNLLLHKVGARIWFPRILISWGAVAALTGFVHTAHQLYLVRFLLGLAEAGYVPGVYFYVTYWFPKRERARAIALFNMASAVASIVGAPISTLILDHVHWMGVSSWRWLLVLEAFPAIILGFITYFVLPSRPQEAKFLSTDEKKAIQAELGMEEQEKLEVGEYSALRAMASPRVWHLILAYVGVTFGSYTLTLWGPQVVKSVSGTYSNSVVGLLTAIPSLLGLGAMILVARSSDRRMERRFHVAACALAGAAALLLLSTAPSRFYTVALLSILAMGTYSIFSPFWAIPSEFLTGASAAAGIALINSVGNLGGFVGSYAIGAIATKTGSLSGGLIVAGASLLASAILVLLLSRSPRERAMG